MRSGGARRRAPASGRSRTGRMEGLVLLLVLLGARQSQAIQECGQRLANMNRIVEGKDTVEGEFPWQASVQWKDVHLCGASLISREWVVTAAHCFHQTRNLTQYRVVLGAHQLLKLGPNARSRRVRRIIPNPRYARLTTSGDIALMQLETPVNYTNFIQPICLPDVSVTFPPGKVCWVTGWGNLRPWVDLPFPQTLQKLQVPIIDTQTCRSLYHTNMPDQKPFRDIQQDMICAGYAEGVKDACNGDSGGPMACSMGNIWVLTGVVSWGIGCAVKNRPGVYSRLTSYQNWIQEYIPDMEFVKEPSSRESRDLANVQGPVTAGTSQAASAAASTLLLLARVLYLI